MGGEGAQEPGCPQLQSQRDEEGDLGQVTLPSSASLTNSKVAVMLILIKL